MELSSVAREALQWLTNSGLRGSLNIGQIGSEAFVAMVKWAQRIVVGLVVAFVAVYGGDWAVYKMRGSPQGSVAVSQTLVVPLKGNKSEYDYLGTSDMPCSVSIFSQDGKSPCWQLRRNRAQNTNL